MSNLRQQARSVKKAGRKGDKHLIHISPDELMALMASGRVTRNPKTGLPEAWGFSNIADTVSHFAQDIGHGVQSAATGIEDWAGNMGTDFFKGANATEAPGGIAKGAFVPGAEVNGVSSMIGIDEARRQYGEDTGPIGKMYEAFIFSGGMGDSGDSISAGTGDTGGGGGPGGNSIMPPAQAEPMGDPQAFGGSAFNAGLAMPAARAEPVGGPTSPGGSAFNANGITGQGLPPESPVASLGVGDSTFGPSLFNPEFNLGGPSTGFTGNAFGTDTPFGPSLGGGFDNFGTGGTEANPDWLEYFRNLMGGGGGSLKTAGTALTAGSGLYGLYLANQTRRMANNSYKGDPHRSEYEDQLAALMRDPNSVANMPGYQFGMDQGRLAIQRQGAATGSGGREAIALAQFTPAYAQAAYQQQVSNLMNAARTGQPSNAQLQGNIASSELVSRALASLGYGLQMAS